MTDGFGESVCGDGGLFVVVVSLVSFGKDREVVRHLHPSDPVGAHESGPGP